ncbi:hypothetical protein MGAST_10050 [Mycobacterium gastri 'Wayne']|nr:hypothetical protein MGAST_10050 [Mycobacterium gastri 'Wayne']
MAQIAVGFGKDCQGSGGDVESDLVAPLAIAVLRATIRRQPTGGS